MPLARGSGQGLSSGPVIFGTSAFGHGTRTTGGSAKTCQEAFSASRRPLTVQLGDTNTSSRWGISPSRQAFGAMETFGRNPSPHLLLSERRQLTGKGVSVAVG